MMSLSFHFSISGGQKNFISVSFNFFIATFHTHLMIQDFRYFNVILQIDNQGNLPIFIKATDDWSKWEPLLSEMLQKIYKTWEEQSASEL